MLYLLLAVVCSTAILVAFKLFPRYKINITQAITVNYVVAVSFGLMQAEAGLSLDTYLGKPWLWASVLVGISFIVVFHLFAESTRRAGVALTSVAAKMSVIIPVMLGFFLFKDAASLTKIAGILLALLAFYLTFKKAGKFSLRLSVILFPLLIFLGNGFNDSMLKIVQHYYIDKDYEAFLIMVFTLALLSGLLASLIRGRSHRSPFRWQNLIAGLLLGLLNWYSTYFFIAGMQFFDVSVFVPLVSVSVVTLSSLTGYFVFKESLSRINIIGVLLAMISIVLIATGNGMEERVLQWLGAF
jgi:drug/metabolite transporter (DMT)-like permease